MSPTLCRIGGAGGEVRPGLDICAERDEYTSLLWWCEWALSSWGRELSHLRTGNKDSPVRTIGEVLKVSQ